MRSCSSTVAERDLARERLVRAEQQLLAGLAPGVERARHLRAAERAVVEQAAVLARERHALRDALVDDVDADLGEAVHVRLAGAVVAALDRVVEEPVDAVAVVLVVLRRVDAALRGDAVRAPRRVVEREHLHAVAELAERGGGGRAGEARAHDDDVEAPLVRRVHELHVELVVVPLLGDGPLGDPGVELTDHGRTPPHSVELDQTDGDGHADVPDRDDDGEARPRSSGARCCSAGCSSPRLWNMLHAPWKRWMPSASMATM